MNGENGIFVCKGCCSFGGKGRLLGVYMAGAMFALAWWIFVDGLCTTEAGVAGFEDWAGGIATTLGMIVISLIDKEALRGTDYDDHIPWRARLFLFLGFSMMAGGFAGSVAVLVVKYTSHMVEPPIPYLGIADVVQTCLLMASLEPMEIDPGKTLSERLPSESSEQKSSMTPRPASLPPPTLDQLLKLFNNTDTPPHNFIPDASRQHLPLFSLPKCYHKRKHAVDLTMYWIPKEGEWDEADNGKRVLLEDTASRVPLLDPNDQVVANVSYPLWERCRMEGTCLLANGDLINLAPGYTNRFILIGQKNRRQNIFGWGAGLQNLQPYVSVAANDLALNQTFFVRELKGLHLGNGQIHNGCVRVDDDGWSFGGCQMDLFVVSYVDYLWLYRELDVDRISVVPRNCTVLNYSTLDHLVYMDAESRNETLQWVMNDTLSLMDQTVAVYQSRSDGPL